MRWTKRQWCAEGPGCSRQTLWFYAPKTICHSLFPLYACHWLPLLVPADLVPGLLVLLQLLNPTSSGGDGGRPLPHQQSKNNPSAVVGFLPCALEPDSPWGQPSALPTVAATAALSHPLTTPGKPMAAAPCLRWPVFWWLLLSLLPAWPEFGDVGKSSPGSEGGRAPRLHYWTAHPKRQPLLFFRRFVKVELKS